MNDYSQCDVTVNLKNGGVRAFTGAKSAFSSESLLTVFLDDDMTEIGIPIEMITEFRIERY